MTDCRIPISRLQQPDSHRYTAGLSFSDSRSGPAVWGYVYPLRRAGPAIASGVLVLSRLYLPPSGALCAGCLHGHSAPSWNRNIFSTAMRCSAWVQTVQGLHFDYGPLMFYSSIWIARLCHLSLANGYFLDGSFNGRWYMALWKVIEVAARAPARAHHLPASMGLFLTGIPDSGLNYTPLRFCATLAFALGVLSLTLAALRIRDFWTRLNRRDHDLLYSPEQGIAFTIGTILYLSSASVPLA